MTDDRERGLYMKYNVERVDGDPEGKHKDCLYFVLDMDHDPHALPALIAYIVDCEEDYPLLAADLAIQVIKRSENPPVPQPFPPAPEE